MGVFNLLTRAEETVQTPAEGRIAFYFDSTTGHPRYKNSNGQVADFTGPAGAQGIPGEAGPQGAKGDQGDVGPMGPKGDQGDTGPQGVPGDAGPAGPKGDSGSNFQPNAIGHFYDLGTYDTAGKDFAFLSVDGNGDTVTTASIFVKLSAVAGDWSTLIPFQGPQGPIGERGPQGNQGDPGPQGPAGVQGPEGIQGLIGDAGPQGPAGPQGVAGPQGPKGDQGTGLIPDGYGTLTDALVTSVSAGSTNWIYVVDPDGDLRTDKNTPSGIVGDQSLMLIGFQSSDGTWRSYGQFTGVQGPKGDQGDPGLQGPSGADGATGPQGPQGPQGVEGPMGPTGLQGPKGDTGDVGPAGP